LACLILAVLTWIGCGGSSEFKATLKRANGGDATAQFELAQMYMLGKGTQQNDGEARKWCEKAAAKGLPAAQRVFGTMLRDAYGSQFRDIAKAREWLTKAAEQGDAEAKTELANTPLPPPVAPPKP
jgi:TPR repeat protein